MPGDYDYYTTQAIETATSGIRAEAKKWFGFSDTMEKITQNMSNLTLKPTAFAVIDVSAALTMVDQSNAYDSAHRQLTELFRDGTAKMDSFGNALNKCADEYEKTDGRSAATFDAIAKS